MQFYLGIPVSKKQRFNEPDGLARHSLDVARIIYRSTIWFAEHERWLATIADLLHEIGRVSMRTVERMPRATGSLVSYDILNF